MKGNKLAWRLNEAVDKLAGTQCVKREPPLDIFFQESIVMVRYCAGLIYGSFQEVIVQGEHDGPLEEYLCQKFGWTLTVFSSIDWAAMKTFSAKVEGVRATNLIKMVMNWQNNNRQNVLLYSKSPICPAYHKEDEGHLHFLHCSDSVLRQLNMKTINKVVMIL